MKPKTLPGPSMLRGIGAVKGSSGTPKLPRKKRPSVVSTSQYKQKGFSK